MDFDWKGLIRTVAPTLATTLTGGNPLAGMAVSAISESLLGKPDGTEEEVSSFMENLAKSGATAETLAKLQEVENNFIIKTKELGIEAQKLDNEGYAVDAGDRANARGKEERTDDPTPKILAAVFIFGFFAFVISIMIWGIPQELGTKEIILILVGVMAGAITQILNYYFGSSKGSADKNKMLSKIGA